MLVISLPALPAFAKVGGNARYAHPMSRYRAQQAEKGKWTILLREASYGLQDGKPILTGLVRVDVTLVFPDQAHHPDQDNTWTSLKPLFDCLEVWRVVNRNNLDPKTWKTRGFAGLIADDKCLRTGTLTYEVDRTRAPQTVLTLTPLVEG